MKAVYIEQFGDSKTLKIGEVPTPEPGPSEVQIRLDHTSVNPVDWKIREGYLESMMPHVFPLILGWDAAGTVTQVGANVTSLAVGDEVYSYARQPTVQFGTYAEYTVVDASAVAAKPLSRPEPEALEASAFSQAPRCQRHHDRQRQKPRLRSFTRSRPRCGLHQGRHGCGRALLDQRHRRGV